MVVCRYFQNGTCRFGDRCRYEHPRNNSGYNQNASSNWHQSEGQYSSDSRGNGKQNNYNQGNYRSPFANQNKFAVLSEDNQVGNRGQPGSVPSPGGFGDSGNTAPQPGEILDSIKRDAEEWEASGMWPYSTYRPNRAHGDVPGLQDVSPEELRLAAYMAEKENSFDVYKSAVSASMSGIQRKRSLLKKPSPEVKNGLISLYRGPLKGTSLSGQSIFGQQDISTLEILSKSGLTSFQSTSAAGGFPSPSPSTSLFSNPAPANTSAFGAPASPPHGLFGNQTAGSSVQSSALGGSGGIFGTPAQQLATSGAPTGLFGKPAQPQTTAAPTGLFGKPAQPNTGLFGKPASQGVGLFGKPVPHDDSGTNVDAKWYTLMSELTSEEKEQFQASAFTLGKIPTRPPAIEFVKAGGA